MTNEKAIELLMALQEPEAWESQITDEAYEALDKAIEAVKALLSADSELIDKLDFGINASTGNSAYMVGLRNGLRLAKSYVDGSDPQFEEYAETEVFEWCDTCKEYDQEKHCCHRFSKVIRQAFEEMKVVHCIDCRHSEYDEVYKDRYCHYNGKAEVVDDYHYCRDGERRDDE